MSIWAETPIRYKQTVAPTEEPVTVAEAMAHCRVTDPAESAQFTNWIKMCREKAQGILGGKAICTATYALYLEGFPCGREIRLPMPPLVSVSSVSYEDADSTTTTFTASNYQVDTVSEPGRIVLAPNVSWPTTESGNITAVTITYVAGVAAASVSYAIKQAILAGVALMYEFRGDDPTAGPAQLDNLLEMYLATEMTLVA